jgi:outer membrane autotransporter protein
MNHHKKGLSVSKLAAACSLALMAQASASDISNTSYETFYFNTTDNTPYYQGYVGFNNGQDLTTQGNISPGINNAVVRGVISTYYLNANASENALNITNSTVRGMITSQCMTTNCAADTLTNAGVLSLTVDNSTIDDTYEHYNYDNNANVAGIIDTYNLGTAITLDQQSNIVLRNNSRVAGITLTQGYDWAADSANNGTSFNNNVTISDSALTSGAWSELDNSGFYGQSGKPSDYHNGSAGWDDVALDVSDSADAVHSMKTNVVLDHSTLTGDVAFASTFNANFYPAGHDSNADGTLDTNGGYAQDSLNQDELNLTLQNGSKWVGAAMSSVESTATLYDVAPNSILPESVYDTSGHVAGNQVFQSGLFNVALDTGSRWDTRGNSNIDTLTVNNGSLVNITNASSLLADSVSLNNLSGLNIANDGFVATDTLSLDNQSQVSLLNEGAELYANQITVDRQSQLNLGLGQVESRNMTLANGGTFNVGSRAYILNSDLNSTASQVRQEQGIVALNSDGHLSVNGDVNGNFRVNINDATGKGSVADYKNKEVIRVYDNNTATAATFTANNKADLGAYRYEAKQAGDTVVLKQRGLTDAANIALSIPSANTNIWNLEQDMLANRLSAGRHSGDAGGVWASYTGGNFNADGSTVSYDQDVNGIMIGVDKMIEGDAKWMLGMAAGFAKGDVSHKSGSLDQDTQSARVYASAQFDNHVFLDSSLSYSRFSNDLTSGMSDGQHVTADNATDGWGFGLKLGYDWAFNESGYVTPYAAISGLFQNNDSYKVSNGMNVGSQSYNSLRYEAGVDAGYTFNYGSEQSLTPFVKLAYVYDDAGNNDARINGDRIDNSMNGSAVRAGVGGQFNFSKNFATYADTALLKGGDVDQDWSANVGVKYRW